MAPATPYKHVEDGSECQDVAENIHGPQCGVAPTLYAVSGAQLVKDATGLLKLVIF